MLRVQGGEPTLPGQTARSQARAVQPPQPCSASAGQGLLLERLSLAWSRRIRMFFHREGKNHLVLRLLCYRTLTHSAATACSWLGAGMWGAGHGHTTGNTHLFSGEGLLFGRGVGVSPAWGSLTGRKDSNKTQAGWWTWRDGGLWHRERDVCDSGFRTLPGGGQWPPGREGALGLWIPGLNLAYD